MEDCFETEKGILDVFNNAQVEADDKWKRIILLRRMGDNW
jgi:hypothetical protein